jgi:hypothetical protein
MYVLTNDLKMQTLTDNPQIRPLVREGAPRRHNSNRQQSLSVTVRLSVHWTLQVELVAPQE